MSGFVGFSDVKLCEAAGVHVVTVGEGGMRDDRPDRQRSQRQAPNIGQDSPPPATATAATSILD